MLLGEMMDAGGLGRYWGVGGRRCGSCGVTPAAVHCRTCPGGGAYLCAGCDAGHARAGHERVWVCEGCERAPAAVTCRADAAALCTACDADIHDANPLARRHERVPVQPIGSAADAMLFGACAGDDDDGVVFGCGGHDAANKQDGKLDFLFADVMDPFLGPEFARFLQADSVVPNNGSGGAVAAKLKPSYTAASFARSGSSSEVGLVPDAICGRGGSVTGGVIELDFAQSKAAYLPYFARYEGHKPEPIDPNVVFLHDEQVSSVDAGAVPERSDGVVAGRVPTPATAESREARLMRYREKRKNRRFQKTIRYASRKAYAETRPRVKGRFAKRIDDNETDAAVNAAVAPAPQPSSYPYVLDFSGYGVVPSF